VLPPSALAWSPL